MILACLFPVYHGLARPTFHILLSHTLFPLVYCNTVADNRP